MRRFTRLAVAFAATLSLAFPAGLRAADELPPAPAPSPSSTAFSDAVAVPVASAPVVAAPEPEPTVRRFERVFFISLPFTSLYSAALTVGVAAVIQVGIRKDTLRITVPYQVAAAAAACAASAWIAWHDKKSPPPEVPPAPPMPAEPAR